MAIINYEIPQNITKEDEFMYNLMAKLHGAGSHYGFIMGSFTDLLKHMEENGVSSEIIKETQDVFDAVDEHLKEYNTDIYEFSSARWEELGKPLSLEAHQAKKRQSDALKDK